MITSSIITIIISSWKEETYYYGKILPENQNLENIYNINQLLNTLGEPAFIDPIENKYYYYSEERLTKNFFENKIVDRKIIFFQFNSSGEIILTDTVDLKEENDVNIVKETTKNNIIKRGLIEKIFGGVGKNTLPNTTN